MDCSGVVVAADLNEIEETWDSRFLNLNPNGGGDYCLRLRVIYG